MNATTHNITIFTQSNHPKWSGAERSEAEARTGHSTAQQKILFPPPNIHKNIHTYILTLFGFPHPHPHPHSLLLLLPSSNPLSIAKVTDPVSHILQQIDISEALPLCISKSKSSPLYVCMYIPSFICKYVRTYCMYGMHDVFPQVRFWSFSFRVRSNP